MIAFGEGSRACWLSYLGLVGVFVFVGSGQLFLEGIIICEKKGFEIVGISGLCQQLRVEGEGKGFG